MDDYLSLSPLSRQIGRVKGGDRYHVRTGHGDRSCGGRSYALGRCIQAADPLRRTADDFRLTEYLLPVSGPVRPAVADGQDPSSCFGALLHAGRGGQGTGSPLPWPSFAPVFCPPFLPSMVVLLIRDVTSTSLDAGARASPRERWPAELSHRQLPQRSLFPREVGSPFPSQARLRAQPRRRCFPSAALDL